MYVKCDACEAVNPPELSQIHVETGQLVASDHGQHMRARKHDVFFFCPDCRTYAVGLIRQLIAAHGYKGLLKLAEEPAADRSTLAS